MTHWIIETLRGLLSQPGGAVGGSVSVPVTATGAGPIPQRPPYVDRPSPNYRRTPGRRPSCVVIHATAAPAAAGSLAWLCDPTSKVSAHWLIDRWGIVYRLVHEEDVAWHAGVSVWNGRPNVNDFSVGIELDNENDGITPYPEPQRAACRQLVQAICAEYGIAPSDVVSHAEIAPGRKNDPMGFDMIAFRAGLA